MLEKIPTPLPDRIGSEFVEKLGVLRSDSLRISLAQVRPPEALVPPFFGSIRATDCYLDKEPETRKSPTRRVETSPLCGLPLWLPVRSA